MYFSLKSNINLQNYELQIIFVFQIILKQLVEASIQLQDANIFHRDIKAENVLIERSSEGLRAYLIDFGLSRFDRGRKFTIFQGTISHFFLSVLRNQRFFLLFFFLTLLILTHFLGTHALRSPEYCTQKKYSAGPTTVWQLGVILFEVLHYKNFETNKFLKKKLKISKKLSKSETNIILYLLIAYINLSSVHSSNCCCTLTFDPPDCQDILTRCLMTDPEERPTLQELLNHPWFL